MSYLIAHVGSIHERHFGSVYEFRFLLFHFHSKCIYVLATPLIIRFLGYSRTPYTRFETNKKKNRFDLVYIEQSQLQDIDFIPQVLLIVRLNAITDIAFHRNRKSQSHITPRVYLA